MLGGAGKTLGRILAFLSGRKKNHYVVERIVEVMLLSYVIVLLMVTFSTKLVLTPDQIFFLGLVAAMFLGRGGEFVKSWAPVIILIVAYDAMRGVVDEFGAAVHFLEPVLADKSLFGGTLPTTLLQNSLYVPGTIQWYDILALFTYCVHFLAPLAFAYLLWLEKDKVLFKKFSAVLVIVSYAALITFLLYPVAPPWMAAEHGFINAHHIMMELSKTSFFLSALPSLYSFVNANPVAAIPSLHAAYPFIVFIFAIKLWGRKALPALLFPIGVGFLLVYLGEHYVIDVLIGFAYAIVVYLFVEFIFGWFRGTDHPNIRASKTRRA